MLVVWEPASSVTKYHSHQDSAFQQVSEKGTQRLHWVQMCGDPPAHDIAAQEFLPCNGHRGMASYAQVLLELLLEWHVMACFKGEGEREREIERERERECTYCSIKCGLLKPVIASSFHPMRSIRSTPNLRSRASLPKPYEPRHCPKLRGNQSINPEEEGKSFVGFDNSLKTFEYVL